jgi:hypothetical protein
MQMEKLDTLQGLRIDTYYTQHVNGSMWSYMPLIPPDLFRRGKERK